MEKTAESLGDINLNSLNNLNINDMLLMTQKMVAGLTEDDMKDLTSNMGSIMEGLGGFDGILQFGQKSGLFNSLFPSNETSTGEKSGPTSVASNPLLEMLSGTLGSALQSLTGSSSSGEADSSSSSSSTQTPLIPGMPAELENMFANIGNSLINAANSSSSSSSASSNPLESILKSLQASSSTDASLGGAEEKKDSTN